MPSTDPQKPGATARVLYLSLEAPREGVASYAHVHEIIAGLRRRGWAVDLFAPYYATGWARPGLASRMVEYVKVQCRLIRSARPGDSVYVRSHFLAIIVSLWARLKRVPIIHEINGPYEDVSIAYAWARPLAGIIRWLWRLQFHWADHLITVTPQLKDWAAGQLGPKNITVIPNGANTDMFQPGARSDLDLPPAYVVFFGGLARWQGVPTLLQAKASPGWPDGIALVIVGDGPERALVEQAAAQDPDIHFLDRQPYLVLPGIIAGSRAGLVPKNNLGDRTQTGLFPLKVFETLACGVPAIVTDFPGQADLIRDHDCGLAVPAEDPDALAAAVAKITASPEAAAAMGRRGRDAILAAHSWDIRAGATAAALSAVANMTPGQRL